MPQSDLQSADKKYFAQIKGINTEAPLVAWPEGFTIDEQNFDLLIDGSRRRRPGLVLETEPEIPVDPEEPPPPEPEVPPETDCWYQIVKLADTTRTQADAQTFDTELQFDTIPDTSYRIVGFLKFRREGGSGSGGSPDIKFTTDGAHGGMLAMLRPGSAAVADADAGAVGATVYPQWPSPYNVNVRLPIGGNTDFDDKEDIVIFHIILRATADTGTFGLSWTVAGGTKTWTLLPTSWMDIRIYE